MSKEKYLVNNMSSSGYLKGGQNDSKEVIQSTLREFRALFDVLLPDVYLVPKQIHRWKKILQYCLS